MEPDKNKISVTVCPAAVAGTVLMMLLRVFDKSSALSVCLVILGMTAFLWAVRHASSRKQFVITASLLAVTFAVRFYGYTGGPAADIVLGLLVGLIIFFLMAAERLFRKFEEQPWYVLIFPVVYLLFMYFTEVLKINMPFRLDPYFSCMTFYCQITALLGIYFLDFMLGLTASALVWLIDHRISGKSLIIGLSYLAVLALILVYDGIHLKKMEAQESAKTDTVRVAYVTGPYSGTFTEASDVNFPFEETLDYFNRAAADAASENAEILLFSEEAYCIADTNEEALLAAVKAAAAEYNMHILLAFEVEDSDDSEGGKSINKLDWISPEGQVLYDYTKHCIIPVIETSDYVRGDKLITPFEISVHGKTLTVATAICYDSDFELFMSSMGKNIDMVLIPTWDWKVIAWEHFGVARLRAISTETTLIRSVYDGWSAVIDSTGEVLACDNTNNSGYASVLVYDVPVK